MTPRPASPLAPGILERVQPRRIALFRASRIGDFLCATPAWRAIREAYPDAEITLIGLPIVADMASRCPSIDCFEPFPGMPGIAEQFFDARRANQFFRRMQERQFDVAIQMHGSGVYSNPVALLLGARFTAGFIRESDLAGRLDAAFPVPGHLPEIERLLAFAEFLGAPARGPRTEFVTTSEDEQAAERLLARLPRPILAVQPGAREMTKRWPADRFAAAANAIVARHGGAVVVLGGPEDGRLVQRVRERLTVEARGLWGDVTVPVMGAVIRQLALLITNDSGPAHVAYALNTPTVTVFGGTEPRRWRPLVPGPFRLLAEPADCRPCDYPACPFDDACLHAVVVEQVVEAAEEVGRWDR